MSQSHTVMFRWVSIWYFEWLCRFRGAWLSLRGNYPYEACHALKYAYRNETDENVTHAP